ncbi:virulence RhuM family protein [Viscerimonas tarda]
MTTKISENKKNEIILYQPDSSVRLEVRVEDETVWLTQSQMAELFQTTKQNISLHLNNAFKEGEIEKLSVVKDYLTTASDGKNYNTKYYNLDVIISVGYRVKSLSGVQFRKWATKILKEYTLRGYALNQRFEHIDNKLFQHEQKLLEHQKQIDFFVRTSLPPVEGVFYNGQIFDAYKFVSDLIEMGKKEIILIDNYIDASVLALLTKRKKDVKATIFTGNLNKIQPDLNKHNAQYPKIFIEEKPNIHDRFLLIDNDLYHIGASLKDLGKKLFAFSKMEMSAAELLKNILTNRQA